MSESPKRTNELRESENGKHGMGPSPELKSCREPDSKDRSQNGPKTRKTPMRRCMGCGEHRPKRTLMRVVRAPDGTVSLDFTGKKSGRGAYVCMDPACLRRVRKNHRLERCLECAIADEVYERMERELAQTDVREGAT